MQHVITTESDTLDRSALWEQVQVLLKFQIRAAGTSENDTCMDAPELPTKETQVRKANFDAEEDADTDSAIWQ